MFKGTDEAGVLEQLAKPVSLLLNAVLAFVVADFAWAMVATPELPAAPAMANSADAPSKSAASSHDQVEIAALHLLGEFNKAPPPKPKPKAKKAEAPKKVKLKPTKLKLVLRGVIRYPDKPDQTRVMLVGSDGKEKVYRIGDSIDERAKLLDISSREVILEVDGEEQVLAIAKLKSGSAGPSSRGAQSANSRARKRWPANPRQSRQSRQTPARPAQ